MNLLAEDGINATGSVTSWRQLVKEMKSKVCFVSLDPEADKIRAAES